MPIKPAPVTWLTAVDGRAVGYQIDPELLLDFMLRAGITQAELARRMDPPSSKGYITDIVKGRRQPAADKLKAIAVVLDVMPRALLLRAVSAPQSAESLSGSAA